MDLEASLNSRHHDFWSISKQGTVSYQWSSWEDFDAYMKDTVFVVLRAYWNMFNICLLMLFNHIKYWKKPLRETRGSLEGTIKNVMKWSWLTQLQLSVALVCPPGSLHIFAVFVFDFCSQPNREWSKSKLPIWWCYYPIIGPIFRMRTTPKTFQDFFLQLGGVRFDPGYDLSCGWFASIWSFTVDFVTKVA